MHPSQRLRSRAPADRQNSTLASSTPNRRINAQRLAHPLPSGNPADSNRVGTAVEYAEVASSERKGKKRFACGEKSGNTVRATVGKRVAGQICTLITYRVSQSLHYETLRTGGGYSSTHFLPLGARKLT